MTLRDQIEAKLNEHAKPKPFVLTVLDGLEVNIHSASPRNVREWWLWFYDEPAKPKMWDQIQVEMFRRFCVDGDDKVLFPEKKDVERLREINGFGAVLEEFCLECRRHNWLFVDDSKNAEARARFFANQPPKTNGGETGSASDATTHATDSSTASP